MKRLLLCFIACAAYFGMQAQNRSVSGQVLDSESESPVIGAVVRLAQGNDGVFTDATGAFTINAKNADSLIIAYVGYTSQTVSANAQQPLIILLSPKLRDLDEIVVIGYGQKSRRDVTGSVSSIDTESLEKKPIARLENALQGQAAGVQVTQFSGKPGNGLSIRVRGATSLSASSEPLFVIDGVPILNPEGINPADVASIEILKDASASAIYGARAANGVVLITTKNGHAGKPQLSYNGYVGVSQVTRKLDMLQADQFVELINEAYTNSGQSPRLEADDWNANTDWQSEIYRKAVTQNHQVSISGGNAQNRYYISLNQQGQEGIVKGSSFDRIGARFNLKSQLSDRLRVGTNLNFSQVSYNNIPDNQRVNQGGVILGALSAPPIIRIFDEQGRYTENPLQAWENPIANIEGPEDVAATFRLVGAMYLEWDLLPDLTFKSSLNTETYFNKNDYFLDQSTRYGSSKNGIASTSTNQQYIWLTEHTLTYQFARGDHELTALGGFTAQSSRYESTWAYGEGFANGAIPTLNAASANLGVSSYASEWALLSFLGRISYKFSDKYLADVNFRADGSSRFGAGNRFAYFPSVSLGWRISEESFMETVNTIDDAKLRLGVGSTGNQDIGDYAHYGLYSVGSNYIFGEAIVPGTRPSTIANDNLKWETTDQYNVGLDLTLINYRLNVIADAYYKYTRDLLVNVDLPTSTGFNSGIQNLGAIENRGLELAIKSYNITKSRLNWTTSLFYSMNRNKVLDIGGQDQVIFSGGIPEAGQSIIIQEGLPVGTFYGYKNLGVNPETGDLVFEDLNGDGEITEDADRTILGNANPDFILGLSNSLAVGPFNLDILFQGVYGNEVFNATRIETEGMQSVKNATAATLDRWQQPGDITRMPRALFGDSHNTRISDRFIEDGSHIRLRNITLTYQLPQSYLNRIPLEKLSIYFSGQNLLTWSNYSGYDPEVNRDGGSNLSQGIDYGTYPQARIFTGGVQLEF
ncbi:TonB-dependent receptor [Pontibacter sp. G13]|uniref:SusC/RagA family TonB-linked outer membrane protein n=1 Tax=Pontibacter sp. G13 TaxID=3074898 RepID=UPI00288B670B|nr:TonB-dependent receptor [Pontibacter sp. G13]WNJ20878.1 TonB-dependent receptor [Pontibacter sp. G13]